MSNVCVTFMSIAVTGCSSIRLSASMAELALVGLLSGLGFIFHTAIGNSFTQKRLHDKRSTH